MASAGRQVSVHALTTIDEVRNNQTLWNWPGTRDSDLDIFLYSASAQGVLRPHVLVLHRGDVPEAMLIGKLECREIPIHVGFLKLRSPRLRVLTFVYGGLQGSTNRETTQALLEGVLASLRRREADVAMFEPVAVDAELFELLRGLPRPRERGLFCPRQNRYRMHLPPNSESLQQMIPAKQRRNYLRKGRKLVRDFSGNVRWRWYRQPSPEMYTDLEFIAARSYQRGLGVGFEDTPELRRFWELAASKGWLRVCILYVADKPCAFFSGMVHSGILWGDYMAYDRRFATYSPGMYLLLSGFGELCGHSDESRVREINLGPGDSDLKVLFSSSRKQECSVYLYSPTLRGVSLNLLFSLLFFADGSARAALARGNPLAKAVKRLRRARAHRTVIANRLEE